MLTHLLLLLSLGGTVAFSAPATVPNPRAMRVVSSQPRLAPLFMQEADATATESDEVPAPAEEEPPQLNPLINKPPGEKNPMAVAASYASFAIVAMGFIAGAVMTDEQYANFLPK